MLSLSELLKEMSKVRAFFLFAAAATLIMLDFSKNPLHRALIRDSEPVSLLQPKMLLYWSSHNLTAQSQIYPIHYFLATFEEGTDCAILLTNQESSCDSFFNLCIIWTSWPFRSGLDRGNGKWKKKKKDMGKKPNKPRKPRQLNHLPDFAISRPHSMERNWSSD